MPDLEMFEATVKMKIKQASAANAQTRLEAVRWLGEAGDPQAITALLQAYQSDPNPQVQDAARYALGMFRKLDEELSGNNAERTLQILEDVALREKFGKRLRIPQKTLSKLALGLLLSAVLVVLLALFLPPFIRGDGGGDMTNLVLPIGVPDRDRATLLQDISQLLTLTQTNTDRLLGQYQGALANSALDCTSYFDLLEPYLISANNTRDAADLAGVAKQINSAIESFNSAKTTAFDRVCLNGEVLTAADYGTPMQTLVSAVQLLPQAAQSLTAIQQAAGG